MAIGPGAQPMGRRQSTLLRAVLPWVAVGLALRFGVFELHSYIGNADQVKYTLLARGLLRGELPPMRPGLTALIAAAIAIGIPEDRAAQSVSLVTGTLMLFLIWLLAMRLYGPAAGVAAVVIAVFDHHLIQASTNGMKMAPMLCAMLGALVCLDAARKRGHSLAMYFLCGLLFGVAYTIRAETLVYFVGIVIAVAGILIAERTSLRRLASVLAVSAAGFAVFVIAGTLLGSPLPTPSIPRALLVYDPMYADKGEAANEQMMARLPEEWLADLDTEVPEPSLPQNVKRYVLNLYAQVSRVLPSTVSLPLWSLCILGLFGSAWRANRWKQEVVLFSLWLFFFTAAPLAQLVWERHLLPYLVIGCCWAGAGAVHVGKWYARTTTRAGEGHRVSWRAAGVAVGLVCALQLKPDLDFVQSVRSGKVEFEEKAAGKWLRDYGSPDDIVFERKSVVFYYAHMRQVVTPYTSYNRCIEYAKRIGARFLVVSSRHTEKYRPELAFLLDDEPRWGPELKLVHEARNEHAPEMLVRIFEVVGGGM